MNIDYCGKDFVQRWANVGPTLNRHESSIYILQMKKHHRDSILDLGVQKSRPAEVITADVFVVNVGNDTLGHRWANVGIFNQPIANRPTIAQRWPNGGMLSGILSFCPIEDL